MDVQQVKIARCELGLAIEKAVQAALDEFHAKTGLTPTYISVPMIDVTTLGGGDRRVVGKVSVEVRL